MTEFDSRTPAQRRRAIARPIIAGAVISLSLLSGGCGDSNQSGGENERGMISQSSQVRRFDVERLKRLREEKDVFLRESPDSPIPADERPAFSGLRYFSPDSGYAVAAEYVPFEKTESISMMMTSGDPVTMTRAGSFKFQIDGESVTLTAYKNAGQPDRLFLPFRDATNGELTYWGGRYLEVHEVKGESYTLDFNDAFNPYCAYNHAYSCPVVPLENILDVPIRAGEQIYGPGAEKQN